MANVFSVLFGLVGSVFAGIAIVIVLMVPAWAGSAITYIPLAVVGSLIIAGPISWYIASEVYATAHNPSN